MEDFRTALKATSYAGYDGASEIDLTDPESIRDDYFALDLHQPHCEEPMQGAAELMGTHADSIELVEDVRGKFALYRCLYNGTEVHQAVPVRHLRRRVRAVRQVRAGRKRLVHRSPPSCHVRTPRPPPCPAGRHHHPY